MSRRGGATKGVASGAASSSSGTVGMLSDGRLTPNMQLHGHHPVLAVLQQSRRGRRAEGWEDGDLPPLGNRGSGGSSSRDVGEQSGVGVPVVRQPGVAEQPGESARDGGGSRVLCEGDSMGFTNISALLDKALEYARATPVQAGAGEVVPSRDAARSTAAVASLSAPADASASRSKEGLSVATRSSPRKRKHFISDSDPPPVAAKTPATARGLFGQVMANAGANIYSSAPQL